jgi:predicted O-methyltransferase YrrM
MWQNPTEFEMLYRMVEQRQPKRILEIGAFFGGTLWNWFQLPSAEVIVSVDLPVPEGSEHHKRVWQSRALWGDWAKETGVKFLDLIGRSDDWFIRNEAEGRGPYDFMFIDGDHSYDGVKNDFVQYRPMLARGGAIAFHDTIRHEPGVIRFAEELKDLYPWSQYFSPDWGAGILVVYPNG